MASQAGFGQRAIVWRPGSTQWSSPILKYLESFLKKLPLVVSFLKTLVLTQVENDTDS